MSRNGKREGATQELTLAANGADPAGNGDEDERDSVVSFRVPRSQLQLLQALAIVNETTVASGIRAAIASYLDELKRDPTFQRKVEAASARQARMLNALKIG